MNQLTGKQIVDQVNAAIDFAKARHAVISTLSHMLERGFLLRPVFDKLTAQVLLAPHAYALCRYAEMLRDIADEQLERRAWLN